MSNTPSLQREIGLWRGVALNMIDMVGIGPFITIPLILTAMGGARGMLAWVLGGLLAGAVKVARLSRQLARARREHAARRIVPAPHGATPGTAPASGPGFEPPTDTM